MRSVRRTELPAVELDEAELRERLEATYGIFDSPVAGWARIRSSPPVARWVSAERRHPQQRGRLDADGSYEMEVPFGDGRELLMDMMRYDPQAEGLGPPALRALAAQLHAEAAQRHADRAKPIAEPIGAKRGRGMTARRPPAPVEAGGANRIDNRFSANPMAIGARLILGADLVKRPG